ncbi:unnamed protein product [marine sediment metagenome]|uniref:YCII-related domain-containing protein n=1 Tax=marine sediment metagenome TaxID=412755 RepID=X1D704_9ZZZZ
MPKFKYYIVYGNGKDWENYEAFNEAFKKFGEVLKKYNMELVLYGSPFGTTEGLVYVMKGNIEDYTSIFGNKDYEDANPIEGGQRTNMVLKP